ncbi:MAG TPA: hypothetical protein PLF40_31375, partial [Kofleriaceae bacterium]|nr:hypothetical protein [Kofleriaceae bacterium]
VVRQAPVAASLLPPPTAASALPVTNPLNDPDGWFALGDAAPPSSSAVRALAAALELDAQGNPWVAIVQSDFTLALGHVEAGALRFEPVAGWQSNGLWFGLGHRGNDVLVANTGQLARLHDGAWTVTNIVSDCTSAKWETVSTATGIDRGGRIYQSCVQVIWPKAPPPQEPYMPSPPPAPIAARLVVGAYEPDKSGWQRLTVKTLPANTKMALTSWVNAAGEVEFGGAEIRIDSASRMHKRIAVIAPAESSPQPWLVVRRAGRRLGIFHGAALATPTLSGEGVVAVADGDGPWQPLVGAWPAGVSGKEVALSPAIAIGPDEQPAVAWSTGSNIALRRWDGKAWQALPDIPGRGPLGLAVDQAHALWVGDDVQGRPSHTDREGWGLRRVTDAGVEVYPPLVFSRDTPINQMHNSTRPRLRVTEAGRPAVAFEWQYNTLRMMYEPGTKTWVADTRAVTEQ